jgi:hypothetical protein
MPFIRTYFQTHLFGRVTVQSAFQLQVAGRCAHLDDKGKPGPSFQKAYLFTALMFIGEFMCLGWYYFDLKCLKPMREAQAANEYKQLGGAAPTQGSLNNKLGTLATGGSGTVQAAELDQAAAADAPKPPVWFVSNLSGAPRRPCPKHSIS